MKQQHPLVSVIVPNYNRSHLLRLCLSSVRAQTYTPIEVIVADDGSTDDSAQVAKAMGATVVATGANRGQSTARNVGAEHATGDVFFFLDSDIALDPDAIEQAVTMLQDDPRLGAVCGILHPESLVSRSLAAQYRALQMFHWWMPAGRPTRELHAALLAVPAKVFAEIGPFHPHLRDTEAADYRSRLVARYEVRLTAAVRGRHDHDSTLRMILQKVFRRAHASALEWRRGELPGDSRSRAVAGVLLLGAVLLLPLPFLVGAGGALASPLLAATAIALDGATYRQVFAARGLAFGLYFSVVHLLVTLVGVTGALVGAAQRSLRRRPVDPAPSWPHRPR